MSLGGAALGAIIAWNAFYRVVLSIAGTWDGLDSLAVTTTINICAAAIVLSSLLATVWWRCRTNRHTARLLPRLAMLVTAAGLVQ
jgi:hypothetical protein